MNKHLIRRLITALFFMALPFTSMAWGLLGHRIIGQIADSYLSRDARKAIRQILGNESVAMGSNWADYIKSDPNYNYLSSWHYINIPPGKTREQVDALLATDSTSIYARIHFLSNELKNKNLPHDKQVMYLRLLIHFVEDLHQPLHVGRPDDQGGNKVKVTWMSTPTNLHSLWDSQLINFQQLSYTEYAAALNFTTKTQRREWNKESIADWLWNSYQLAETIYGDIKEPEQKLSYDYNFKYIEILNGQLLKGGVHLAALLNEIFD